MNKTSLWIVVVITATWIGFLFGYAASSHSGSKGRGAEAPAVETPAAGGYGR
ncbi:MAG: hypothetical protein Q7R45_04260 [Sulfuricaulis sp.]|nr:hypothetical protein [Sulfuricaulis sp.]